MSRIVLYFLLVTTVSIALAINADAREELIDRLNFCCTNGCNLREISELKFDAEQYFTAYKDDALDNLFKGLLFSDRGCGTRFFMNKTLRSSTPLIESLLIPIINVDEMVRISHLAISAPNGLASIYIYGQNALSFAGYAYITPDANPTSINTTFAFISEFYVGVGVFNLTISIADKDGFTTTFIYSDLELNKLQSTVVYAAGECDAGYYKSFNSSKSCQKCPLGTYSKKHAFSCSQCPAGQGVVGSPGTSCAVCAAGFFSTGSSECRTCPAGTYSQAGSYACVPCQTGTYSAAGADSCTPCSVGTYASSNGQGTCKSCPIGTYSSSSGSYYCMKCRPGTYSSQMGAASISSCTLCPEGTFGSESGSTSCTSCHTGYTSPEGSTSELSCFKM